MSAVRQFLVVSLRCRSLQADGQVRVIRAETDTEISHISGDGCHPRREISNSKYSSYVN